MQLLDVADSIGQADIDAVTNTVMDVARKYEEAGLEVRRPVIVVVEDMPIMGATEPTPPGYRLHIGVRAVSSGMLDGLIAHEMGHMLRMDADHPSHNPSLHRLVMDSITVPPDIRRGFLAVTRRAINHVEDIYADDLAFEIIGARRAEIFFTGWINRSAVVGGSRLETVGNSLSVAFALGNTSRHSIVLNDGVLNRVKGFAIAGQLDSLQELASEFRDLPETEEVEPIQNAMHSILATTRDEIALH